MKFTSDSSDLYRTAVKALQKLRQAEGLDSALRAAAEVLSGGIKAAHVSGLGFTESSGFPCALRLVGRHGHADEQECVPPGSDHSTLLLRNGVPVRFVSQPYSLGDETLRALLGYADKHGLRVSVNGLSWHFPARTFTVVLSRPT